MVAGAQGKSTVLMAGRNVAVCIEEADSHVAPGVVPTATMLASQMFAEIGVTIEWERAIGRCQPHAIRILLAVDTPAAFRPGAMAYALPFEGTHIRVFYDRIAQGRARRPLARVLAHVFAHEIGHLLQAQSRHSEEGIMKTRWTLKDFNDMNWEPLRFTDEDVTLIYAGLSKRAESVTMLADAGSR
jgi:hypothetical protein